MTSRGCAAALAAVLAGSGAPSPAAPSVTAHPQRPSLSLNSATADPGYVELEAGATLEEDAFELPLLFKIGLTRSWELDLEWSPLRGRDLDGNTETGIGDLRLGAKVRFFESPEGNAALFGFVKIPTADEDKGLGTGDTDAGFRFIASRHWNRSEFDFNLGGEFAGVPESTSNDAQWTVILTWSRQAATRFSYFGDVFLQFLPAADVENISTNWGVHYAITPALVLDGSVNIGLSDDAPDLQVLVGVTSVLGRMFRRPEPVTGP